MGDEVHGSAVAWLDRAVLITGAPGSGKSALAAGMIALGAELVADDRVMVEPEGADLMLAAPGALAGLLEIRSFGLVRLPARARARLCLIADLDAAEPERLPPRRRRTLSGRACPVMLCKGRPGLAEALICILRAGDWPDPETFMPGDTPRGGGTEAR